MKRNARGGGVDADVRLRMRRVSRVEIRTEKAEFMEKMMINIFDEKLS